MIDGEISLKSLLYVTESLEKLIGPHGAKAVLRTAGQRAAIALIEMLPLSLPGEEAARRSGAIMVELGFINELQMPTPDTVQIVGNHIYEELTALGLHGTQSACFYVIGLFEGFFKQMSGSDRKVISVEPGKDCEIWKLSEG
jgi:predicted hydrocarbon binding protein